MPNDYHIPALLEQTIEGLHIKTDGIYVDATFGGGGHSRAILEQLGKKGKLFSFDQDIAALTNQIDDERWEFIHGNFRYVANYMDYYGVEQIDGLVADLGVSFYDFDTAQRGFSFRFAGPLDMRMNTQAKKTASDILNTYTEEELARIFALYGELADAKSLARKIKQAQRVERTEQLVAIVTGRREKVALADGQEVAVEPFERKKLSQVFQALRIEVNDELGALQELLQTTKTLVKSGGYVAILSYHSLEDRMVKNFFASGNVQGEKQKDFYGNLLKDFEGGNKVIVPSQAEIEQNPRSRSAKLRVARKI